MPSHVGRSSIEDKIEETNSPRELSTIKTSKAPASNDVEQNTPVAVVPESIEGGNKQNSRNITAAQESTKRDNTHTV